MEGTSVAWRDCCAHVWLPVIWQNRVSMGVLWQHRFPTRLIDNIVCSSMGVIWQNRFSTGLFGNIVFLRGLFRKFVCLQGYWQDRFFYMGYLTKSLFWGVFGFGCCFGSKLVPKSRRPAGKGHLADRAASLQILRPLHSVQQENDKGNITRNW